MNYHDTVPSEPGYYWCGPTADVVWRDTSDRWYLLDKHMPTSEVEQLLPLIGPLPETADTMLALACEVAFARMWLASRKMFDYQCDEDFAKACIRFEQGERSLSLLRDLQLVTRELTREQQETP